MFDVFDDGYVEMINSTVADYEKIKELHGLLLKLDDHGESFFDHIVKSTDKPKFWFKDRDIYKEFFKVNNVGFSWLVGSKDTEARRTISVTEGVNSYIFGIHENEFPVELFQLLEEHKIIKEFIHELQRINLLLT
jgi:hypothetical protein